MAELFRDYAVTYRYALEADFLKDVDCPVLLRRCTNSAANGVIFRTHMQESPTTASGNLWPRRLEIEAMEVLPLRKRPEHPYRDRIFVGRAPTNDVTIMDGTVSKVHVYFSQDPTTGAWSVTDVGSRNGVTIDRQLIPARSPASLSDKAVICLGTALVVYFLTLATLFKLLHQGE